MYMCRLQSDCDFVEICRQMAAICALINMCARQMSRDACVLRRPGKVHRKRRKEGELQVVTIISEFIAGCTQK